MDDQQNTPKKIPKLRPELEFSLVKDSDEKVYTLFDPYNNRYFQFKDYEYGISQLLDGINYPEDVCEKFEEQFDAILPEETLQIFVQKLHVLGLLEGAPIPARQDKYTGALFIKFKLFNPDKLFDILIKYVGFVFHPLTTRIFFVVILIAGYILLKKWHEVFTYGLPLLDGEEWIGYFLGGLIIVLIISTHEFAHGLSLKYFGGKVPEIGLMFLLFLPAAYCDVSDAWKLPKKQKLFVTFAGGFYEIVVGAFGVIIWSVAEPHLWLADIAYLTMVGSIFTIGFNFNPLIRLDGYYLLSDFLEMPNLRSDSVQYLMQMLVPKSANIPRKQYTGKEKIVYFIYGILSSAFIFFMLYLIFTLIAGLLIDNFRLGGVVISIVLLTFLLSMFLKGIIKTVVQVRKAGKQKAH